MASDDLTIGQRLAEEFATGQADLSVVPKASSIPTPAEDVSSLYKAVRAIKSVVDTLTGTAGSALDKALTTRDLINEGTFSYQPSVGLVGGATTVNVTGATGGGGGPVDDYVDPRPVLDVPPTPTNLVATGAFKTIVLSWDLFNYRNHAFTEVWRATTDNLAVAVLLDSTEATIYTDASGTFGAFYYYWVRAVSDQGVAGAFNASSGTLAALALIGNTDLGPLIIEADNLANGSVIGDKLAVGSIAVGSAAIANGAIRRALIELAAIDTAQINDLAVTNGKVANLDATKITTGFLSADRIAALSITAGKIDTRGLTIKDASGNTIFSSGGTYFSPNLFYNGDFSNGLDGWGYAGGVSIAPGGNGTGVNLNASWWLSGAPGRPGSNVFFSQQVGGTTSTAPGDAGVYYEYVGPLIAIEPGKRYVVSGYAATHRCAANLFLYGVNAAGSIINWSGSAGAVASPTSSVTAAEAINGGTALSGYKRLYEGWTPPAGTVFVRAAIRKYATNTGDGDSYVFLGRVQVEQVPEGVSTPGPWSPGLSVQQITTANASTYIASAAIGSAQIGTITANQITTGALTGQTITGGTLQTAGGTGKRVVISESNNEARFYDASNNLTASIGLNTAENAVDFVYGKFGYSTSGRWAIEAIAGNGGYAIVAQGTTGVIAATSTTSGTAIIGNTGAAGTAIAGAAGSGGWGVYGEATRGAGYGVYGRVLGGSGAGVLGVAAADPPATGTAHGVQGISNAGHGGHFTGNTTKSSLFLTPQLNTAMPAGTPGSIAMVQFPGIGPNNVRLCYSDQFGVWRYVSSDSAIPLV
jgi:hypothetical protein